MKAAKKQTGLIFVVSGPSGSGKTTLVEILLRSKQLGKKCLRSISFTTRPQRSAERQGREYFFISQAEFKRRLKAGKILEWTKYLGYYYGTPKDFISRQIAKNKNIILCLDLKGARAAKKIFPGKTRSIFVLPPSLRVLPARIAGRCHKTLPAEIRGRLKMARKEVAASAAYDYRVTNNNLAQAVKQLEKIILKEIGR